MNRSSGGIIIFLFLLLFWMGGLLFYITLIPKYSAGDHETTEAIVVLTGGRLRIERGFQLLLKGRAPVMFISGVENGVTLTSLLKSKEYRAFAGHVPAGSVELGYKARSTIGNADETAQWVKRHGITSIRLVTANYHLPRSIYELHKASPDLRIIPEPVFPKRFDLGDWWQRMSAVGTVIWEYNKYLGAIARHQLLDEVRS